MQKPNISKLCTICAGAYPGLREGGVRIAISGGTQTKYSVVIIMFDARCAHACAISRGGARAMSALCWVRP